MYSNVLCKLIRSGLLLSVNLKGRRVIRRLWFLNNATVSLHIQSRRIYLENSWSVYFYNPRIPFISYLHRQQVCNSSSSDLHLHSFKFEMTCK